MPQKFAIDPFDLVGMRPAAGTFLDGMHARLGRPEWLLRGTGFEQLGKVPEWISVRDWVMIFGNRAEHMPDDPFYIEYALSGVPMFSGSMDVALRNAPSIRSLLKLLVEFASDYSGHIEYRLFREQGRTGVEILPRTRLGSARAFILEMSFFLNLQMAARLAGEPLRDALVELRHPPPPYAGRLQATLPNEVRFSAERDAISFADEVCDRRSVAGDSELFQFAMHACRERIQTRGDQSLPSQLKELIVRQLVEQGNVPRIGQAAGKFGVSSRTMVRRLKDIGLSYQALVDQVRQHRSRMLLAETDLSVADISTELGFSDASGFQRSFRRWFGKTPARYRAERRTN